MQRFCGFSNLIKVHLILPDITPVISISFYHASNHRQAGCVLTHEWLAALLIQSHLLISAIKLYLILADTTACLTRQLHPWQDRPCHRQVGLVFYRLQGYKFIAPICFYYTNHTINNNCTKTQFLPHQQPTLPHHQPYHTNTLPTPTQQTP